MLLAQGWFNAMLNGDTAAAAAAGVTAAVRLYQKVDWLMLLAEGHTMYYGKADQVRGWHVFGWGSWLRLSTVCRT